MSRIAKWKNFTKEQLQKMANESNSLRQFAEKIGYQADSGSGMRGTKAAIEDNNIDISHFSGQSWNKNNFDYTRFKKGNAIKSDNMKNALVALRGHKCEKCKL